MGGAKLDTYTDAFGVALTFLMQNTLDEDKLKDSLQWEER